jgi:hypothetical protein
MHLECSVNIRPQSLDRWNSAESLAEPESESESDQFVRRERRSYFSASVLGTSD